MTVLKIKKDIFFFVTCPLRIVRRHSAFHSEHCQSENQNIRKIHSNTVNSSPPSPAFGGCSVRKEKRRHSSSFECINRTQNLNTNSKSKDSLKGAIQSLKSVHKPSSFSSHHPTIPPSLLSTLPSQDLVISGPVFGLAVYSSPSADISPSAYFAKHRCQQHCLVYVELL